MSKLYKVGDKVFFFAEYDEDDTIFTGEIVKIHHNHCGGDCDIRYLGTDDCVETFANFEHVAKTRKGLITKYKKQRGEELKCVIEKAKKELKKLNKLSA